MKTIDAFVSIPSDFISYHCPVCGSELIESEDDFYLTHPSETDGFFGIKKKAIKCDNSGKRFGVYPLRIRYD